MPPAEYSSKSDFSKAEVVKAQVMRCNENRSKEMKQGYFNYTMDGRKIYVADARKQWVSSVKALRRLLEPEAKIDKNFKDSEEKIMNKEKELFKKFAYTPKRKKNIIDTQGNKKAVWVKIENRKPYIPEIDANLLADDEKNPNSSRIKMKKGIWNHYVNLYWDFLVEVYDELFAELNNLIHKNNYFKQKVNYGFDIDGEFGEDDEEEE